MIREKVGGGLSTFIWCENRKVLWNSAVLALYIILLNVTHGVFTLLMDTTVSPVNL